MTCAQSAVVSRKVCTVKNENAFPPPKKLLTSQLLLVLVAALMNTSILIGHVNKLMYNKSIASYTHLARYILVAWACMNNAIFFYAWNSYNSLCIHLAIHYKTWSMIFIPNYHCNHTKIELVWFHGSSNLVWISYFNFCSDTCIVFHIMYIAIAPCTCHFRKHRRLDSYIHYNHIASYIAIMGKSM